MGDVQEYSEAVVPKKRGRPANPNAQKKEKTGRGRGRPPKSADGPVVKKSRSSDTNGDAGSDDNDDKQARRGRPAKGGKLKLTHSIVSTGKGRGRPKLENGGSNGSPKLKKSGRDGKTPKKSGRPRKQTSDEDASDDSKDEDDEEEHTVGTVGRPPTGAVNLNISRTGRGQGRPKKSEGKSPSKRVASNEGSSGAEDSVSPKKRGRPPTGKAVARVPTGKPRGRPKADTKESDVTEDEPEEENEVSENEKEDENENETAEDSVANADDEIDD